MCRSGFAILMLSYANVVLFAKTPRLGALYRRGDRLMFRHLIPDARTTSRAV